jgi:tetratricopeptide (TPR) repeat protein
MKKIGFLIVTMFMILFLVACGNEEVEKLVKDGDKSLEAEKYDEAIGAYLKAFKLDTKNTDVTAKLLSARKKKFEHVMKEAGKYFEEKDYENASKWYKEGSEVISISEDEMKKAKDKYDESEELIKKQKSFDEYAKWSGEILERYFKVSNEWDSLSTSYRIKGISHKVFKNDLTAPANDMSKIRKEISNKSFDIENDKLLEIHNTFAENATLHSKELVNVIGSIDLKDKEIKRENVLSTQQNLDSIKTQLASYINQLKSFAESDRLKYEFQLESTEEEPKK